MEFGGRFGEEERGSRGCRIRISCLLLVSLFRCLACSCSLFVDMHLLSRIKSAEKRHSRTLRVGRHLKTVSLARVSWLSPLPLATNGRLVHHTGVTASPQQLFSCLHGLDLVSRALLLAPLPVSATHANTRRPRTEEVSQRPGSGSGGQGGYRRAATAGVWAWRVRELRASESSLVSWRRGPADTKGKELTCAVLAGPFCLGRGGWRSRELLRRRTARLRPRSHLLRCTRTKGR